MIRITGLIRSTDSVQLDGNYGPYNSIPEAHEALSNLLPPQNKVGVTVGIEDSITHTIEEFWYQGGTDQINLVKKQTAVEVDTTPTQNSPNAVSSGGVYNALQGKANTSDIPTISTNITTDATSDAKTASPKAVKTYVDNGLTGKQNTISASNTINSDFVDDTNGTNKFVTSTEKGLIGTAIQGVKKGTETLTPVSGVVTIPSDIESAHAKSVASNQSATATIDSNHVLQLEIPRGADAVNPFKGYFNSLSDLQAKYTTGETGDFANVYDSTADKTYRYVWDTSLSTPAWTQALNSSSQPIEVTPSTATFATGEELINVGIDNDFMGGSNRVASAEEVKELNEQINGGDIESEENHDNTEFTRTSSYGNNVIARGTNQPVNGTSFNSIWALPIPENTTRIEAVCSTNNQYYYGLSFFNSNIIDNSAFLEGISQQSGNYLSIDSSEIPQGATHIVVSVGDSILANAYVKLYTTEHTDGIIVDSLDSDDATKALSAKQGKILNEKTNGLIVQEKGTSTISAMSQKAVTDILDGTSKEITQTYDSNSFDQSYIVNRTSHTIDRTVTAYKSTQRIEIPNNLVKIEVFGLLNNQYYCGVAFDKDNSGTFDYEYPKVSGLSASTNDGPVTITKEWIDENASDAKYFIATAHSNGANFSQCYVKIFTLQTEKGLEERISDLEESVSSIGGYSESMVKESHSIIGKAASLTTSDELAITIPDTFKCYQIAFSMNLSSAFDGRIQLRSNHSMCHGRIEIDGTNVYFYDSNTNSASPSRTIAHGLTIQNNISVCIIQRKINWQAVFITIITDNGIFTDENILDYWYMAYNVPLTLKMVSGSCTNAELVFTMSEKSVWLFGDSYLDYIVRRVDSNLNDNIKNLLIDGFPGRNSQQALASLNKSLAIATPKILVWGMGMNDGDDNGAIDTNWKSVYDLVNEICQNAGIELVLVTIPTTPTVDNNQKNAFIKASGHRYVDVAAAVGADGTGNWTSGYLSSDNVHPTTEGARVVLGKYVASLPEVFE